MGGKGDMEDFNKNSLHDYKSIGFLLANIFCQCPDLISISLEKFRRFYKLVKLGNGLSGYSTVVINNDYDAVLFFVKENEKRFFIAFKRIYWSGERSRSLAYFSESYSQEVRDKVKELVEREAKNLI